MIREMAKTHKILYIRIHKLNIITKAIMNQCGQWSTDLICNVAVVEKIDL